jgi:hypothetical protein
MVDIIKYPYIQKNILDTELKETSLSNYISQKNYYKKDSSIFVSKDTDENFFIKKMLLENNEELNIFNMNNKYKLSKVLEKNTIPLSKIKTPNTYPQVSKKNNDIDNPKNRINKMIKLSKASRSLTYS